MANELINKLSAIKDCKDSIASVLDTFGISASSQLSTFAPAIQSFAGEQTSLTSDAYYKLEANYITENCVDGFVSVDYVNYPGGSANAIASADHYGYRTIILQAQKDFDLWGSQEDLSSTIGDGRERRLLTVYPLGKKPYQSGGTRYRVNHDGTPDGSYPTESSPLHIKTGQYVMFSQAYLRAGTPPMYQNFKWRTSEPMSYGYICDGCGQAQYLSMPLRTDRAEALAVYLPSNGKYVRWNFEHVYNMLSNADSWHLGVIVECDRTFDYTNYITRDGEIEMAIKLSTSSIDYMGGIAHGDEVCCGLSIEVNDELVDQDEFFQSCRDLKKQFKKLKLTQESFLYNPNDELALSDVTSSTPYAAKHFKSMTFQYGTLSIDQRIEWNVSLTGVKEADYPMMTPIKYYTKNGEQVIVTDAFYTRLSSVDLPQAASIPSYNYADISAVTVYGKESNIMLAGKCIFFINGVEQMPNVSIRDNGNNYNKTYFVVPSNIAVNVGDVWESHSSMKISI